METTMKCIFMVDKAGNAAGDEVIIWCTLMDTRCLLESNMSCGDYEEEE